MLYGSKKSRNLSEPFDLFKCNVLVNVIDTCIHTKLLSQILAHSLCTSNICQNV